MSSPVAVLRAAVPNPDRFPRAGDKVIPKTTCPACGSQFNGLRLSLDADLPAGAVLDCCHCGSLMEVIADGLQVLCDHDHRGARACWHGSTPILFVEAK